MKKLLYTLPALLLMALVANTTFAKPAKVDVCHRTGNGSYHVINVSERAWPAHEAHGDHLLGDADSCEEAVEPGLDLTLTTLENWPSIADSNDYGEMEWQAEGRYGSNTDTGDWELGVGNDTQVVWQFEQAQYVWGESPAMEEFTVEYDADTGVATFTVNGESASYMVGTDPADNLYLVARASFGEGDYVTLSDLMFNGTAITEDVMASEGSVETLKVEGADLNSDFTITGDVEMVYTSTAGSAPSFQVQVSSGI